VNATFYSDIGKVKQSVKMKVHESSTSQKVSYYTAFAVDPEEPESPFTAKKLRGTALSNSAKL
jgi:hypothetical protein